MGNVHEEKGCVGGGSHVKSWGHELEPGWRAWNGVGVEGMGASWGHERSRGRGHGAGVEGMERAERAEGTGRAGTGRVHRGPMLLSDFFKGPQCMPARPALPALTPPHAPFPVAPSYPVPARPAPLPALLRPLHPVTPRPQPPGPLRPPHPIPSRETCMGGRGVWVVAACGILGP